MAVHHSAHRHLYASIHFPEDVWHTLMRYIPYAPLDLPELTRRRLREAREVTVERPAVASMRLVVLTASQIDRLEGWLQDAVTRVAPAAITSALRCVQAARRIRVASRPPALSARGGEEWSVAPEILQASGGAVEVRRVIVASESGARASAPRRRGRS